MRNRTVGFGSESHDLTATKLASTAKGVYLPEQDCNWGVGTCIVEQSGDTMSDVIGLSRPWPFKPCFHDEYKWTPAGDADSYSGHYHYGPDYLERVQRYTNLDLIGFYGLYNGRGVIDRTLLPVDALTESDYYQLTRVWEDRIIPRIRPEMDLLVFLIELGDIANLAKSLARKITNLPRLLSNLSRKPKGFKLGLTLDRQLDSIAENWLEYNFALKPTVTDLIGILNGLLKFRKKLEDLQRGAGKIQKGHGGIRYSVDNSTFESVISVECPHYPGCSEGLCPYTAEQRQRTSIVRPVGSLYRQLGITVLYRYVLPDWLTGMDLKIRTLLQSIGLVPGLEVIWEIIPFSFVIDWFLPIGQLLSKYRIDPVPVKTEILDICFTQRTYIAAQLLLNLGCNNADALVGTIEREVYERETGVEFLTRMPHFKWPNLFQLSLGAALLKKTKRKG